MNLNKNMGKTDKIVRLVAAAIIILLDFTEVLTGSLAWILSILAVILAATAMFYFCQIYQLLGMSTKEKTT